MRNFYDRPVNRIFDGMFGKGARQIQADPSTDLRKCNCCNCTSVECKTCMEGHVISATAGCCHGKNHGLIFEYERPQYYGQGMQCCRTNVPCCPSYDPPPGCIEWGVPGPGGGFGQDCGDANSSCNPNNPNVLPLCSTIPPYVKTCCGTGKVAAENVRFYYNYIGQYFKIDFDCTGRYSRYPANGLPRLCSFCDPSSLENDWESHPALGQGTETCLDYLPPAPALEGIRKDDGYPDDPSPLEDYPCSSHSGLNIFSGCKCMGYGDLKDPAKTLQAQTFTAKRLSRYRKRQMEASPQHRWLLDIMCYDQGNVVLTPYYEYQLIAGQGDDKVIAEALARSNGGTLYQHLIGVVHCEHWYEIARCSGNENPQHNDPGGVLGGWITDLNGETLGANTTNIAPRFWIYACSGVPIFDFEIERARRTVDEFGSYFINDEDYEHIVQQFAQKRTPKQSVMLKLAKAGLFDIGDWRQPALNDITVLQGLSYTAESYGVIKGYTGDEGACCFGGSGSSGSSGDMNSNCVFMKGVSCGICGGSFFLGKRCTSDLCENCSGFKPHSLSKPLSKYLGPVRKKLFIPYSPYNQQFGINYIDPETGRGVTRPAFLDPRKARPNNWPKDRDTFENNNIPPNARGRERDFDSVPGRDDSLVDLQLPEDLLPMPWGNFADASFYEQGMTMPNPPNPGEPPTEEYEQFKTWVDTQWLYLHARPGGWDYVCYAFQGTGIDEESPIDYSLRIPNLRRKYSNTCTALGCCLDGVKGWPQRTYQVNGSGCDDINCGYIPEGEEVIQAPLVSCNSPLAQSCFGLDCNDEFTWCSTYPEQGGGAAPCRSLAMSGNCEGIRFVYYRHRQVNGDDVMPNDYTTCNGTVRSWVYRVNMDSGNYGDFCPHFCRPLTLPKRITDSLPVVFSNRLAAGSLCEQYYREDRRGTMCPGLYCLNNSVGGDIGEDGVPIPPFYGPATYCCGGKNDAPPAGGPIPTDPTHPASNRTLCPLYPGPPCFTPTCRLYDGRFVGTYYNFNPSGCCWKCKLVNGQIMPDTFVGIEQLYACGEEQPDEVREFDNYQSNGRGFIPFDQIANGTSCDDIWAGYCACGTNQPSQQPPLVSGLFCEPSGTSGGDDVPGS